MCMTKCQLYRSCTKAIPCRFGICNYHNPKGTKRRRKSGPHSWTQSTPSCVTYDSTERHPGDQAQEVRAASFPMFSGSLSRSDCPPRLHDNKQRISGSLFQSSLSDCGGALKLPPRRLERRVDGNRERHRLGVFDMQKKLTLRVGVHHLRSHLNGDAPHALASFVYHFSMNDIFRKSGTRVTGRTDRGVTQS